MADFQGEPAFYEDEELSADDPANVLRRKLNAMELPDTSGPALGELLYTAKERNLLGDINIRDFDAVRIWLLVELSRVIPEADLAQVRM